MMNSRKRFGYVLCTKFSNSKVSVTSDEWNSIRKIINDLPWSGLSADWLSAASAEKITSLDENPPKSSQDCKAIGHNQRLLVPSKRDDNQSLYLSIPKAEKFHSFLDGLPQNGPHEHLLDVIWFTDTLPTVKRFPSELFGALKRCVEWHGGSVIVITHKIDKTIPAYVQELRAEHVSLVDSLNSLHEFLDRDLVWRGSLSFFDDESMGFYSMAGFELAKTVSVDLMESLVKESSIIPKKTLMVSPHFSQRIKVISKCSIVTVPTYFLTNQRYILRTSLLSEDDDVSEGFLNSEDMFGNDNCIIAKLERYEMQNGTSTSGSFQMSSKKASRRTTEAWKKAVREGTYQMAEDHDLMEKSLQSVFFLICNDPRLSSGVDYEARNCLEKVCIVLNPSIMCGGLTKSYDVIHDNLSNLSNQPTTLVTKNEFKLYDINIDLGLIKSWVDEQTEAIQKEFLKKIPQSTFTASHLQISRNYLLKRFMQDCVGPEQIVTIPDQSQCPDCNSLPLNGYEAFPTCETEEKRFLAFIEHCKRQREEKKRLDETMTPSGNFVVLEAKEMLKHFTPEGLAVNESDTLRQLATSKSYVPQLNEEELKATGNWPEVLLTEYHGLYYNKSEASEKSDAVSAKLQQMYVGSRETASTCHGLNASQTVVTTTTTTKFPETAAPLQLRRTPRKRTPSNHLTSSRPASTTESQPKQQPPKDPQSIYRQKLRGAVYDALTERGMKERDPLFRPCFKRLFDICNIFAKDMPPKNQSSTKQWLATVARQNSDSVISLEKSLRVGSK